MHRLSRVSSTPESIGMTPYLLSTVYLKALMCRVSGHEGTQCSASLGSHSLNIQHVRHLSPKHNSIFLGSKSVGSMGSGLVSPCPQGSKFVSGPMPSRGPPAAPARSTGPAWDWVIVIVCALAVPGASLYRIP